MAQLGKIPATVITGFLGAGKTTMIRNMLENANGRRIALIINEFGDLGVDRGIINGCGIEGCAEDDVVELANGCICCTVADDFLPTIRGLIDRDTPPDHIVIETSGLALPKPLVKAFNWPEVRSRVTVDGVVAVLDGAALRDGLFAHDHHAVQAQREADENLDHESPLEELFEEQLHCADMVVLNKTDLLTDEERTKVEADIRAELKKPSVKIIATEHSRVENAILLGLGAAAEDDLDSRPSHHDDGHEHDHDDFESFVVSLDAVNDPAALEKRLIDIVRQYDVLRIKGFLDVPGKPMRHVVQGVGERFQRYFDRPWADTENRRSELVVIGLHGLDRAAIEAAIKAA
ncbi:cobalamin biosynthesis protein CobW [Thalassospira povalilytica]|uniref:Cobalamin biosynthesis protein CobW n=2 Tax=Thalassospira TaxID=168934 RepID=A0ABX4R8P6_9PROT|nr:cobalamin biosynthesis protein CobW [Thalassospira povalilytica]PKR50095.1 cobalamin biosynthesis protein CobW [Thalassospira povalilytica]